MRVAIIGAGSIGMTTGALIAKHGGQVELIDVFEENVKVLNEKGATITGTLNFTVPVTALTPDQMSGTYDVVVLLCKQTVSKEVLEHLLPFLSEESTVCTLQNGIPEETVAQFVGWDRTVGGIVCFGATWLAPGITECTSDASALEHNTLFVIGDPNGEITPRIKKVQKVLSLAGGCELSTNLMGERWTKVMMNATFSGLSASLNCTFGDILDNDLALTCACHLADESVKACHARGLHFGLVEGNDFEVVEITDPAQIPDKKEFLREKWELHRKLKASMLQDLEKGHKTEIDFINGQVCKVGREVGLATPYNNMVVSIVKAAEAFGQVMPMEAGLRFFETLHNALEQAQQ